ncbi:MAG: type II toxin-antitoxin system PemK/MazF family toxin [bacterium]|nr:type II toxin-antitoxin system PemK/MazF family toxin [bacterium]
MTTVRRGEIYWVEFDPVKGSEQAGLRPALVVQQDLGNRYSPTTVVAAMTRRLPPKPYPFVVVLEASDSALGERCAVNCAQLATIQQSGPQSRLRPPRGEKQVRPIARLDSAKMASIDAALCFNLGLG